MYLEQVTLTCPSFPGETTISNAVLKPLTLIGLLLIDHHFSDLKVTVWKDVSETCKVKVFCLLGNDLQL